MTKPILFLTIAAILSVCAPSALDRTFNEATLETDFKAAAQEMKLDSVEKIQIFAYMMLADATGQTELLTGKTYGEIIEEALTEETPAAEAPTLEEAPADSLLKETESTTEEAAPVDN